MLKRWGKTILSDLHFYRSSSPISNNVQFQKSVFGPLYYEILPYTLLKRIFIHFCTDMNIMNK